MDAGRAAYVGVSRGRDTGVGTRRGASAARAPRYNAGTFDGNRDHADKVWYNTGVCMT